MKQEHVTGGSIHITEPFLSAPSSFEKLPIHVWFLIFGYLTITEQVKFGLISRYAHSLATDSSVWHDKWADRWSDSIEIIRQALTNHQRNSHIKTSTPVGSSVAASPSESRYDSLTQRHVTTLTHDWYHTYKYGYLASKHFQVICIDIGNSFTKFFGVGLQCANIPSRYTEGFLRWLPAPPDQAVDWVPFGSLLSTVDFFFDTYWSNGGHKEFFVGKHDRVTDFRSVHLIREQQPFMSKEIIEKGKVFKMIAFEAIVMFIYTYMFVKEMSCQQHPLLLPIPSWFPEAEIEPLRYSMFTHLQFPYLALIDSSVLILHRYGLITGLVVSVGGRFTYVSAVVDGCLLDLPVKAFDMTSNDKWDVYALDLKKDEVIQHYFVEDSLLANHTPSSPVNLVHILNDFLEKGQITTETLRRLKENIIVSGGHAHSVAPVLKSKLQESWGDPSSTNPYRIYAPTEPGEGRFDIVRGAEVFLHLPQTRSSLLEIFTSIDNYDTSYYLFKNQEMYSNQFRGWANWGFTLHNIWPKCGTAMHASGQPKKFPSKQDPNFDHIDGSERRMNRFLRIIDERGNQEKGKSIKP